MPTLPELQAGFAPPILREDARQVAGLIVGRRPDARRAGPGLLEPRLLEPDGGARGDVSRGLPARGPAVLRLRGGPLHSKPPAGGPLPVRVRRDLPGLPRDLPAVRREPVPGRRRPARVGHERRAPRGGGRPDRSRPRCGRCRRTTWDVSSSGSSRPRPGSDHPGRSIASGGRTRPRPTPTPPWTSPRAG